jgi:hypothetical protein
MPVIKTLGATRGVEWRRVGHVWWMILSGELAVLQAAVGRGSSERSDRSWPNLRAAHLQSLARQGMVWKE